MKKLFIFFWLNKLIVFTWLVIIGTNVAGYYSDKAAYQGIAVLAGASYSLVLYHKQILRLVLFKDYLFSYLSSSSRFF